MDPYSRAPKRNTSHGNEALLQLLHTSYKDHVTNEEVHAKIQQAIEPHKGPLTTVAVVWSCLLFIWSGQNYLARHSERGKKTKQTEEEVGRHITESTGLQFDKSQRAMENREKWRKLVAKSSVVPQRPLRLTLFVPSNSE